MVRATKLILIFMISMAHSGYGDMAYKVINFKIPQAVWRQALNPTPVLRSPVTITVPVNVQDDNNEVEEAVGNDAPEVLQDPVPVEQDPVPAVQDPVPIVQDPVPVVANPPFITPSPPLQDEVITEAPPVPGQLFRFPCTCRNRECGCCTGAIMDRLNMKACGNVTFVPEDFVFDVKLSVNNNTVVRRRVSASDPPPICFNPRRAPFVEVCAQISNIQIRNRNAHACLEINADVGGFPVYSASFRCFNFGASGIQTNKKPRPVSSPGPKPVNLFGSSSSNDGGSFIENAAGTVFGDGLFGGGGGDDGPFDGIGDALGDFFK